MMSAESDDDVAGDLVLSADAADISSRLYLPCLITASGDDAFATRWKELSWAGWM